MTTTDNIKTHNQLQEKNYIIVASNKETDREAKIRDSIAKEKEEKRIRTEKINKLLGRETALEDVE